MKIIITMIISASFVAASSGITAETGLMKAVAKNETRPQPIIFVKSVNRLARANHIRELHGDIDKSRAVRSVSVKRERRLAKFKAALRAQKQRRLSGLSGSGVTAVY